MEKEASSDGTIIRKEGNRFTILMDDGRIKTYDAVGRNEDGTLQLRPVLPIIAP